MSCGNLRLLLLLLSVIFTFAAKGALGLKSELLCNQCSGCETIKCPPTESYPHMTAHDDSLIAGALQSDFVSSEDRGVYSVPDIKGGESSKYNTYYGWESTSGSVSGYHRFRNYMDKCSQGQSYLTVDQQGKVRLRSLSSLDDLGDADWKSFNPPKELNHREFRYWVNRRTGKCLTVLPNGKAEKHVVGIADCRFDGSNPFQLFAFRFHYHKAFCCCNVHNN
ncbi:OLC1v1007804C1 [Oldenlandia corymbosa var. corymbosa]|uniref:OLC1v1007804C1 n=1 Tax=Oldenlandia corymbosa var. corymbosa TaxID=529605 RepID=A0AAV1DKM4_OLDCO|nr:OLC1v1007804C1 [Oldenlandia corymbosa var. corymbosa]